MVFVGFGDLARRQDTESEFVTALSARGTRASRSVDLLFPGRTYDSLAFAKTLRDAGIEAVLMVSVKDVGFDSIQRRPATSETIGNASSFGSTISGSFTTSTKPAEYDYLPWGTFDAALYDVSGKAVWVASMSSGGNALASFRHVVRSMVSKTSEQLVKDGIVKQRHQ